MSKVTIINEVPIIITKDQNWINTWGSSVNMTPGAIIVLPHDAVLLILPKEETDGQ